MKITLWVPCADSSARWPCITSWWNLETPDNIKLRLVRSGANNPKYSWNKVVKDFLETDDDYLLSWHSDVVGDPQTLLRLLSWDKSLISALIFMRNSPVTPHIWKEYDKSESGRMVNRIRDTREWFYAHPEYIKPGAFVMEPRPDDSLVPIDFTSTSCTLIHRSVLEGMRESVQDLWFLMDDDIVGGGEDRRFFQFAKDAGFEAFVDRSCVVGHLVGDIPTSSMDFIAWDSVSTFQDTGEITNGNN
jgi:hypothetical protein